MYVPQASFFRGITCIDIIAVFALYGLFSSFPT